MGLFDGILNKVSDHADVENLATKLGISSDEAESAIAALGKAHQQQGDTVAGAAASTGLDPALLNRIVTEIGGEGSLTEFARIVADD